MALFLIQHGKSLSKDTDPEKGLSEQGIAEVKRIADVAKGYNVQVAQIWHSGKKRAFQTAEIFASALNPKGGVHETGGLNPLDDVTAFSNLFLAPKLEILRNERKLETTEGNLMLVGHLPFMEKLTTYLITGNADKRVFKFQNGGIVCLDKAPDSTDWVILWTLMPNIC